MSTIVLMIVNNFNGDVNIDSVDNGDWDMMAVYMYYSFSAIFLCFVILPLFSRASVFFPSEISN